MPDFKIEIQAWNEVDGDTTDEVEEEHFVKGRTFDSALAKVENMYSYPKWEYFVTLATYVFFQDEWIGRFTKRWDDMVKDNPKLDNL